jgi:hypothetical protein
VFKATANLTPKHDDALRARPSRSSLNIIANMKSPHTFFSPHFFTTISRNEKKEFYVFLSRFSRNFLISHFFSSFPSSLVAYFFVDCIAEESQFVFNTGDVEM